MPALTASGRTLVVVSYFDGRSAGTLHALLRQIGKDSEDAIVDVVVVVNQTLDTQMQLPEDLAAIPVIFRENSGFNIGAWDSCWRRFPDYDFYIFLQDECLIQRVGWVNAFQKAAAPQNVGLVGESLVYSASWQGFERRWPEIAEQCRILGTENELSLGPDPTHLQALAIGARREVLEKTDGFIIGSHKINAVASEVLTSVRVRARGFKLAQLAWRPFEYVMHPQWQEMRDKSASPKWSVSRAMHRYLPRHVNKLMRG